MYLTIEETADYLSLPINTIHQLIQAKRIRTVSNGDQILINREQFSDYFDQLERYKERLKAEQEEPIPEDWDAKDED